MSNDLRTKIDSWFDAHKADMFTDLAELVAIRSVAVPGTDEMPYGEGAYKALVKASEIVKKAGFPVKFYENRVLAADMNDGEPTLAMLAHVDVVPEGTGWESDPYKMVERDGALYGRGTADDKGPAIAALYAMMAAREIAPELTKNCRLILGSAEETGMGDLAYYEKHESYPPMVFSPDADFPLINIEKGKFGPTFKKDWVESTALPRIVSVKGGDVSNIVPRQTIAVVEGLFSKDVQPVCDEISSKFGGSITCSDIENGVEITATGISAHASVPDSGLNSTTLILEVLIRLPIAECEGFYRLKELAKLVPHGDTRGKALGIACSDELSGELTANFGVFTYSLTGMEGNVDIRSAICADEMPIAKITESAFGKAGIPCNVDNIMKSHHVPADSPFVQTLLNIYTEFTGEKGEPLAVGGLTYVHEIPGGVAFGCGFPGHDSFIHGVNEHILIDELMISAKIFTKAIIDICK